MIDLLEPRRVGLRKTETPEMQRARKNAAEAARQFPGRSPSGLDFNRPSTGVAQKSLGEMTALQPVRKPQLSEREKLFVALPETIRRAAKDKGITDFGLIKAAGIVTIAADGGKATVHSAELARQLNVSRDQADVLLTEAVIQGLLLEEHSYTAARVFRPACQ